MPETTISNIVWPFPPQPTIPAHRGYTDSGICIGIRPILAYFDGIRIGQVHYTGTNSFVCAILTMK